LRRESREAYARLGFDRRCGNLGVRNRAWRKIDDIPFTFRNFFCFLSAPLSAFYFLFQTSGSFGYAGFDILETEDRAIVVEVPW
jgi:hypothetical protein